MVEQLGIVAVHVDRPARFQHSGRIRRCTIPGMKPLQVVVTILASLLLTAVPAPAAQAEPTVASATLAPTDTESLCEIFPFLPGCI